ncbi:MAG: hypothetical protein RR894_18260 [Terrisporobacter sp.]
MNKQNLCEPILLESMSSGYIIDNGTFVQMGINDFGNLNVPGGTPAWGYDTTVVGLRYILTNGDSTSPGCLCEGWGVANADDSTGIFSAYANIAEGTANLSTQLGTGLTNTTGQIRPESVGSAFKSIVRDNSNRVEVTHDYKPSSISQNLYQVDVTIKNIDDSQIGDLRYRRVMDWDIPPHVFNEFVEIHVGDSNNLLWATTDGFQSADPLSSPGPYAGAPPTTLIKGSPDYFGGPTDQGSLFDFKFGTLEPGEEKKFTIFYGATENRDDALIALSAVKAEVYSLGIPSDDSGKASLNGPNIFMFAFQGVGGTPIPSPSRGISFF